MSVHRQFFAGALNGVTGQTQKTKEELEKEGFVGEEYINQLKGRESFQREKIKEFEELQAAVKMPKKNLLKSLKSAEETSRDLKAINEYQNNRQKKYKESIELFEKAGKKFGFPHLLLVLINYKTGFQASLDNARFFIEETHKRKNFDIKFLIRAREQELLESFLPELKELEEILIKKGKIKEEERFSPYIESKTWANIPLKNHMEANKKF